MALKISVVVPTFRRPKLLLRCLNALVGQNFDKEDYEIIVVSDGPDEKTREAMRMWIDTVIPQVHFIPAPQKKGPAACRNIGWKRAKGELIAFTDDDCVPGPGWLKTIWKEYQGEPFAAYTGRVIVPRPKVPTDYELNIANLETAEFVTANCICTKKTLEHLGGFDERFSMAWREDSDLHFKLLRNSIPLRPIAAAVTHPVRRAPWGVSIKDQKKGIYNALLYKKYPDLYRKRIKPEPSWNYYVMVLSFACMIAGLIKGVIAIASISLAIWLILLMLFIEKRLASTSHSATHVVEMVVTSIVIPFAAIFWHVYGAIKFRVLFL